MRASLVLACGIALAIPIARADGQTVDGLNGKIAAAKDDAEALNAKVAENALALADARKEAALAAGRESELDSVLTEGRERSAELAGKLAAARSQLAEAEQRLQRALDALAARLVDIYKSGEVNGVALLLDADGYDDLTTRADLLGRVQAADRALAERVDALRVEIAGQVDAVERAKRRSDALNDQVAAARDQIAAARAEAQERAEAAAAARASQAGALDELESRSAGWEEQVQKLEQISAEEAQEEVGGWSGSGGWAIPEAIVMCESGGNFSALNSSSGAGGAYQILPSTWKLYGGQGLPNEAPPAEQHRIAAMIWADSGPSAWVCAG